MGPPRSCGATAGHAHAHDMQMSPGKLPCAQHRPEAVRVPRTAQLRPCCGTAYVSAQSIRRRRPRRSARPRRPDGSQAGACRWRGRGRRAHRRLSPHRVRYRWSTWKRSSSRKRALRGSCYSGCRNPAGFFKGANLTNHVSAMDPFAQPPPLPDGDASPRQFHHVPFVALVRPRSFDRALRFNYDIAANPSAVPWDIRRPPCATVPVPLFSPLPPLPLHNTTHTRTRLPSLGLCRGYCSRRILYTSRST